METCLQSYDAHLIIESLRVLHAMLLVTIKSNGALVRLMCSQGYDRVLLKVCSHINK